MAGRLFTEPSKDVVIAHVSEEWKLLTGLAKSENAPARDAQLAPKWHNGIGRKQRCEERFNGGTFLISSSIKYCNNLHRRVSGVGSAISTPILLMTLESADKQPRAYCTSDASAQLFGAEFIRFLCKLRPAEQRFAPAGRSNMSDNQGLDMSSGKNTYRLSQQWQISTPVWRTFDAEHTSPDWKLLHSWEFFNLCSSKKSDGLESRGL
ncbi:hypothetical protein EV424DRAFT_1343042 [Suillus variegatus]|nr:hypothetical protein EV424DRAFT_1343042 [Suillus variegatus]